MNYKNITIILILVCLISCSTENTRSYSFKKIITENSDIFNHLYEFDLKIVNGSKHQFDMVSKINWNTKVNNKQYLIDNEQGKLSVSFRNEKVSYQLNDNFSTVIKLNEIRTYPIQLIFKERNIVLDFYLKISSNGYLDITDVTINSNGKLYTDVKLTD